MAFDVYEQTCSGGGLHRLAAMQVAVFFPVILFLRHGLLLAKDGALFDFAQWRRGCVFFFGPQWPAAKSHGSVQPLLESRISPLAT